jgi:hypothetical protein
MFEFIIVFKFIFFQSILDEEIIQTKVVVLDNIYNFSA